MLGSKCCLGRLYDHPTLGAEVKVSMVGNSANLKWPPTTSPWKIGLSLDPCNLEVPPCLQPHWSDLLSHPGSQALKTGPEDSFPTHTGAAGVRSTSAPQFTRSSRAEDALGKPGSPRQEGMPVPRRKLSRARGHSVLGHFQPRVLRSGTGDLGSAPAMPNCCSPLPQATPHPRS